MLALLKQRNYQIQEKKKQQHLPDLPVQLKEADDVTQDQSNTATSHFLHLDPTPHPEGAFRSPVCPSHSALNPSAIVQVLTLALPVPPPHPPSQPLPRRTPLRPAQRLGRKPGSRGAEINAQTAVIYCLLCSGGGGKKEGNQLQIELSLFEPGQLEKKKNRNGRSDRNHI